MSTFQFGLVHAPVTPFADEAIDFATYGKLLEFHLAHGAEGIAAPTHAGESVSLTATERRDLLAFVLEKVAGRVPVVANASEAGTSLAADLAAHARQAGAAAVMACVPYYWTPPEGMLVEHFAAIAQASQVPFYVYNAPEEMGGVKITTRIVLALLERAPNFAGLIDKTLDWQLMIEATSEAQRIRPSFALVSGSEYMISASAIGTTGLLSSVAGIAPNLVRELYALCRHEDYKAAYALQLDAATLYQHLQAAGPAGLKAAAAAMNRDCGSARPPLPRLTNAEQSELSDMLAGVAALAHEPRGW